MGCDIHIWAEKKLADGTYEATDFTPFDWRAYSMYGFLAGVRNMSCAPIIALPRGLPANVSLRVRQDFESWEPDAHSETWLSVAELQNFSYDCVFEDRRTFEPLGHGNKQTLRAFLGERFFTDLKNLAELGADRIVFWFDN